MSRGNNKDQELARSKEAEERRRIDFEERERAEIKERMGHLQREREELKRAIMEMEERGHKDPDAYRRIEEIDRNMGMLKSELR